ncbi:MAG: peptidoglycan DD-metalloendopeptidase family protein [Candidatus Neomarinimicrobiota bacterium]
MLVLTAPLPAQTGQTNVHEYRQEIEYQSKAIEDLKKELEATQRRIQTEIQKEKSAVKRVSGLEQEISLADRIVVQLRREEEKAAAEIRQVQQQITVNEARQEVLRARYAQRVTAAYKQGTLSDLERVLSATSWRQAIYRTKYLKIISDYDRQLFDELVNIIVRIEEQKAILETALARSRELKTDRERQVADLRDVRRKKEQEIVKIRDSRSELEKQLKEQEEGIKQLEAIQKKLLDAVDSIERAARIQRQQEQLKLKNFAALKGQLPWPAIGQVVTKFGNQWNAQLKTRTDNPGIDIKGQPGSPIIAVKDGEVTTITYIRGFGTTIIVDHGGGYYTVYSHVNNIQINVDDRVAAGDRIAYMGDSGSISGAQLHFEIWGQGQKLNPELWLTKQ